MVPGAVDSHIKKPSLLFLENFYNWVYIAARFAETREVKSTEQNLKKKELRVEETEPNHLFIYLLCASFASSSVVSAGSSQSPWHPRAGHLVGEWAMKQDFCSGHNLSCDIGKIMKISIIRNIDFRDMDELFCVIRDNIEMASQN